MKRQKKSIRILEHERKLKSKKSKGDKNIREERIKDLRSSEK
jgi:hypothetical protein